MQQNDNILYVVAGDDIYLSVTIIQPDGLEYTMQEGDKLIFAVKRNWDDAVNIHRAEFNSNIISLSNNITRNLEPGHYVYDVCLSSSIGGSTVYSTVISLSPLVVVPATNPNRASS